jgi:hypothetical protein
MGPSELFCSSQRSRLRARRAPRSGLAFAARMHLIMDMEKMAGAFSCPFSPLKNRGFLGVDVPLCSVLLDPLTAEERFDVS